MGYLNLSGTEIAKELQGAPHPGHHAVLPGVRAGPAHIGQEVQHGGHGLRGLGPLLPLLRVQTRHSLHTCNDDNDDVMMMMMAGSQNLITDP